MMDLPSTDPASEPYDLATAGHDYPAWHGAPRRSIVICTHPRSGSTLLGEALYFAGGLGCPLEYFHAGFRPNLAARWGCVGLSDYGRAVHRWRTDASGTLSVKLFWRDVAELAGELDPGRFHDLHQRRPDATSPDTYREIAALIAPLFPAADYIHLLRRDRVRQAVSAAAAVQTGIWRQIPQMSERTGAAAPSFDFAMIERLIGYADFCHRHWRGFFAAIGAAPHRLAYEDLTRDHDAAVKAVFEHLGSTAAVPPVRMKRQSDARNETMVLRFLRENAARATAGTVA
ncbi:Stf0 family sulphotransferase [Sphingomonas oligophenolica]|uniref:Stf0 family sulfotransferase n=1 Tax=Sphingomonas oligophenolica TaxID=301154 RepID=A0ABU9Y1T7_9SPHN